MKRQVQHSRPTVHSQCGCAVNCNDQLESTKVISVCNDKRCTHRQKMWIRSVYGDRVRPSGDATAVSVCGRA